MTARTKCVNPSRAKPAFGDAGNTDKFMRRWIYAKPALIRFVCLGLDDAIRTTGNEGVPLQ
jgi:hypothetical protein